MALSFSQYQGDGSNRLFATPATGFLSRDHISVTVDGVAVAFLFIHDGLIQTAAAPAAGTVVEVRRTTPREQPLTDFVDGSTLTESDLDTATLQTFYLAQEAYDIAGGTLGIQSDGSYSANNRRIGTMADPVQPQDAVNKRYFDGTFLPQQQALLHQTTAEKSAAVAARTGSETALAAVLTARDLTLQYRDTTRGYRDEVAAWNANVNAKSANVDTKSANVDTKSANVDAKASTVDTQAAAVAGDRVAVLGYRNEAEAFKNAAARSAADAALFDPSSYYTKTEINGTVSGLNTSIGAASTAASNANANANARVSKSGDTMTGNLMINKTYPMINLYYPSVYHWRVFVDSDATLRVGNGDTGAVNFTLYTNGTARHANELYVGSTTIQTNGNVLLTWRGQWLSEAIGNLESWVNDRVHRVRMVGYGEIGGTGGMSNCAPGVFTGASGTPYGAQVFGYRTLQQHIPSAGGYVNVYVE